MADLRDSICGPGPLGDLRTTRYVYGAFETPGDTDVFAIRLIAGLTYEIEISDINGGAGLASSLRDASGALLAAGVPDAWDDRQVIRYQAEATGTHYLFASAQATTSLYSVFSSLGIGTDGDDDIKGTSGEDDIDGAGDDDVIRGCAGDDNLYGGQGDDRLFGGAGDDSLSADSGRDDLFGGDGDDGIFASGVSDNRLYGGAGDDLFIVQAFYDEPTLLTTNVVDGGAGSDTLQLFFFEVAPPGPVRLDLEAGTVTFGGAWATQTLRSVENAIASDSDDLVIGTAGANEIYGGGELDEVLGRGGADEIYGGDDGDDVLRGGTGDDRLFGGGDFWFISRDDDRLYGGCGNDQLVGLDYDDALYGGAGNDDLHGDRVDEDADVFAGADTLYGGRGADRLTGGGGADVLVGGVGADAFRFLFATDSGPGQANVLRAGGGAAAFENPGAAAGDRIDLSAIDADEGAPGDQAFQFGAASGPARLWLVEIGTDTVVRGDVGGSAGWEFELVIEDGSTRASAYGSDDFVL